MIPVNPHRKVLLQLIGKAEGELDQKAVAAITADDPFEATAAIINRTGGSLLAAVAAAFEEFGVPPTEQGSGLGEWDCGAFIPVSDLPWVLVALTDRFRAAFRSHLLRWHIAVLDPHTDVFQKETPK